MNKLLLVLTLVFFVGLNVNSTRIYAADTPNSTVEITNNSPPICSDTNLMCKDGVLRCNMIENYDTPFDPYEILNTWVPIVSEPLPKCMWKIIMGHPDVDWEKAPKGLDPTLAMAPEGVDISAVFFIFKLIPGNPDKMSNATAVLQMVGHRTPETGKSCIYVLSQNKKNLKRAPEKYMNKLKEVIKQKTPFICSWHSAGIGMPLY